MPFFTGAVLRSQNRPGDLNPVSAPRDARDAIGVALAGIADELARLPWDWRERTAGERALDERKPWYWPSTIATAEDIRAMGPQTIVNTRTGEVMRVEAVTSRPSTDA